MGDSDCRVLVFFDNESCNARPYHEMNNCRINGFDMLVGRKLLYRTFAVLKPTSCVDGKLIIGIFLAMHLRPVRNIGQT